MNRPNPIILLGFARNGTTMLCNTISNIPEVSSIQHELHWGFVESDIYKNNKYWGEFNSLDSYIYFLELYCSMDTFKISGLSKEKFYNKKPKDFIEFYFEMMDEYAIQQGSKYWLTKMDPLYYIHDDDLDEFMSRLKERYKEIKLISIQRNAYDVLASYVQMDGYFKNIRATIIGGVFSLLLGVIRISVYSSKVNKLIDTNRGISFQFENVISNRDACLDKILIYLGINNKNIAITDKYKRNSSFSSNKVRNKNMCKIIYFMSQLVGYFDKIPKISKYMLMGIEKLKPKGRKYPGEWRIIKEKYYFKLFRNELETQSNTIVDVLLERNKRSMSQSD